MLSKGTCSSPAVSRENKVTGEKYSQCSQIVDIVFQLLSKKITSRQIMTKKVTNLMTLLLHVLQAFENAITIIYALGGSTNGVLHLLALAHE